MSTQWAHEQETATSVPEIAMALQISLGLYRVCLVLGGENDDRWNAETIRAWLSGMNPDLGDEVPAQIVRSGNPARVERAAEDFAEC